MNFLFAMCSEKRFCCRRKGSCGRFGITVLKNAPQQTGSSGQQQHIPPGSLTSLYSDSEERFSQVLPVTTIDFYPSSLSKIGFESLLSDVLSGKPDISTDNSGY